MNIFEIIGGILLILVSVIVVITVAVQEPKSAGLGGSLGGDNYMDRGRSRTKDAQLELLTKYGGVALFVLTLASVAANKFIR